VRKTLPFPAWLPDQLPTGAVLTAAVNVLPAANGYRPVKSLITISDALPAAFAGGGSFIASDGAAYLIAGTANGLSRFSAGTWATLLAAMSIPGRWRFSQFGDFVVAVNGVDTKQVNLTTGAASDIADAPYGTSVAVVGPHVVIGQANGNRLLVQWSAFNSHTAWTAGVDQSGFQPMLEGGEVMGLAGGEYGIVLQRFALQRMSLSGDATAPFTFQQITNNVGCASRASIAQSGRTVFFLSDRGFMALEDGQSLRPIGNEKFDQHFRDAVAPQDYEKLWSAIDPKRSLVFWGYPGAPGRIWVYNWVIDRAATIEMPFAGMFAGYESSLTLEAVAALYPNLDTMPYSLDDPRFSGGDPRLYFVSLDSRIGALAGSNLAANMTMGWLSPAGANVSRVRSAWPIGDATGGVTVTIDARQRMGDGEAVSAAATMQASGRVPLRSRGRFLRISVAHAAGSAWTYSEGVELEFEAAGTR